MLCSKNLVCGLRQLQKPVAPIGYCRKQSTSAPQSVVNHVSSNDSVRKKRSEMFSYEKKRQLDLIPRIEKIRVEYKGVPDNEVLVLNKNISTPFNLSQHLSEVLMDRSALAMVNGELWDMQRPLKEDCTVELLHFHMDQPYHVNRAFWRSCSFMLGAALETVFNDDVFVQLHSFPAPSVSSGSFVYDIDLDSMKDWNPSKQELMVISAAMHRLAEKALPFERLEVDANLAKEMFVENKYKLGQIPGIAAKSSLSEKGGSGGGEGSVTLYRVGEHVDISAGPMVGNTSFLGRRCTVAAAHPVEHNGVSMYRFQGVALPKDVNLNHYAFGILEKRAAKLNKTGVSGLRTVNPS